MDFKIHFVKRCLKQAEYLCCVQANEAAWILTDMLSPASCSEMDSLSSLLAHPPLSPVPGGLTGPMFGLMLCSDHLETPNTN